MAKKREWRVGYVQPSGQSRDYFYVRPGLDNSQPPTQFTESEAEHRARRGQCESDAEFPDCLDQWFWEPINGTRGDRCWVNEADMH